MFSFLGLGRAKKKDEYSKIAEEYYRLKHNLKFNEEKIKRLEKLENKNEELIEKLRKENAELWKQLVEVSRKKREAEFDLMK